MDVPCTLREARRAAGLTQRQLAALTGVPQPRIAQYERGRATPDAQRFASLLDGCGQQLTATPRRRPVGDDPAADQLTAEDLQLITIHLAMTPAERLATFIRMNRLRGAARQG